MAVKIVEDEAFETLKKVLNKKDDHCDNLLKKGVRKAAEVFNII
jgi:hypothetical protein